MGSVSWPDGRGILDQPVKLVSAFNIIRHQVGMWDKETSPQ